MSPLLDVVLQWLLVGKREEPGRNRSWLNAHTPLDRLKAWYVTRQMNSLDSAAGDRPPDRTKSS